MSDDQATYLDLPTLFSTPKSSPPKQQQPVQTMTDGASSQASILTYLNKAAPTADGAPALAPSAPLAGRGAGFAPIASARSDNMLTKMASGLGLRSVNLTKASVIYDIPVQSVETWTKARAKEVIFQFLADMTNDTDKFVGFVQILRHYALNTTSNRTPEEIVYKLGDFELDMRAFAAHLGENLRRCIRAFADEIAEVIRGDATLRTEMARKFGVSPNEAEFVFDVANARTGLSPDARAKIQRFKTAVLSRSTDYDARSAASIERDMYGGARDGEGSHTLVT